MDFRLHFAGRHQRADFQRVNQDLEDDQDDSDVHLPRETLLDRENPLECLTSQKFRQIFGFSKDGFVFVLNLIHPQAQQHRSSHMEYLTPVQQLCIFLDFLRTNSFQRVVGTQHHNQVSQSRACIIINSVARMIANLQGQFISMPTPEEADRISEEIFQQTGFPYVLGVVDGTHIELMKPKGLAIPPERFFNRKGYYSLNCMFVADNKMKVRYFTARHCGSAHDARIFQESDLRVQLERDFNPDHPRILIGDEGYGCSKVLLTPIRDDRVRTPSQTQYNKALSRARIVVEHTFGVLKRRFPALLYQSRCRKLENTQALIAAATVLHNITINLHEEPPVLPPGVREAAYQDQLARGQITLVPRGRQDDDQFHMRNIVIGTFF